MNLLKFLNTYKVTSAVVDKDITLEEMQDVNLVPNSLKTIFEIAQGHIFDSGLFRIYNLTNALKRTQIGKAYFSNERSDYYCFGCDWTGRQYAVNYDDTHIFMLDHAVNEFSHLESTLDVFFNDFLVNMKEDILLASEFLNTMNHLKISKLEEHQILGFKVPLLLGGKDQLDNYVISDLDMDWDFSLQIRDQTKNLKDGGCHFVNKGLA